MDIYLGQSKSIFLLYSLLTGGGCLRRLNSLVSPRLREAIVGLPPKEASSSLCQPMLSWPSRYRLHSSELKLHPLAFSTASRRLNSNGCHYEGGKDRKKAGLERRERGTETTKSTIILLRNNKEKQIMNMWTTCEQSLNLGGLMSLSNLCVSSQGGASIRVG